MANLINIPGFGLVNVQDLENAHKQDMYRSDPVKWVEDRLGEFIWSGQRKMMESVRDYRRTAIYSCHRIGKSMCMARVAFWWLDTHPPGEAMVITSAHSAIQVKMALWREMGRVHAKGKFPGRMNQVEYYMPVGGGREEMVAFGRKPADDDTTGFQGTYARYVLVLGDEACYIPDALLTGLDTLISNELARMVLFGNPDDPTTRFAKVCKPGSGWNVLRFGYLNTPGFIDDPDYEGSESDKEIDRNCPDSVKEMLISRIWVEEKKKDWGEDSPWYQSKVWGRFPVSSSDGLIPVQWVQAAIERGVKYNEGEITCELDPIELGVDVGGGGNRNVIACRKGEYVSVIHSDQCPDTMETLENIIQCIRDTGAWKAKVDHLGIGWGACNRATQMYNDQEIKRKTPHLHDIVGRIVGIKVSESAPNSGEDADDDDEVFINLRAWGYWQLRQRFQEKKVILDPKNKWTEKLAAQLVAIKYDRRSGRIQIQEKSKMAVSPDEADSVMLAFLDIGDDSEDDWGTW